MRALKLISLTVFLSLLTFPLDAQFLRGNKRTLIKENSELKDQIDSLMKELVIAKDEIGQYAKAQAEVEQTRKVPQGPKYDADMTDSLRMMWFVNKAKAEAEELPDLEDEHFTTDVPDSVLIARLEAMNSFINLPFNENVRNYIILYTEKNRAKTARILGLSKYYMPIFEETLDRYGLPKELKIMPIIESALDPVATSRAGARGLWQFMYRTGLNYGLTINTFVDERLDVEKSSDAAARYLQSSYKLFGDWILAIASYNCGSGNVNKAIRRAGGRRDFWSIYPYLPRETRGYVPAFVGALYAYTYARECGIEPEETSMPFEIDTFMIRRNLNLEHVARAVGVPVEDIRNLNPEYVKDIIPGESTPSVLRLDLQHSGLFIARQDSIYKADSIAHKVYTDAKASSKGSKPGTTTVSGSTIVYKVKSGDTLSKIAARNHVTVNQLMKWNNLKSDRLSIGQTILIQK